MLTRNDYDDDDDDAMMMSGGGKSICRRHLSTGVFGYRAEGQTIFNRMTR